MYLAKERGRNRVELYTIHADNVLLSLEMKWRSSWDSGEEIIDKQHREMLSLGTDLISTFFSDGRRSETEQKME